jgi:hypothetical protein
VRSFWVGVLEQLELNFRELLYVLLMLFWRLCGDSVQFANDVQASLR